MFYTHKSYSIRFSSSSSSFLFSFHFPSKRTNDAEEVVQVEPQRMWESQKRTRRRRRRRQTKWEKSVNPKIESAALSWPPWSPSSFRCCCCCCCCKKTISKQREIGSRMSRTSFSFSIKKENKTKYFSFLFFYFLLENLNVTGFNNNNNNKAPAMAYREICKRK